MSQLPATGLALVSLIAFSNHLAALPINLGTAARFAVLGGSTVTNTGSTVILGDLGVWPGSAITGFPPGIVTGGTTHANDAVAMQAQTDLTTAYIAAASLPCGTDLSGQDLGGLTLLPGVYCFALDTVDRNPHPQRAGRPIFPLRLSDRKHVDYCQQLDRRLHEQRPGRQRVLAGRQFGNARHRHGLRGKYSRPYQHHIDHRRQYRLRPRLGAQRSRHNGYESREYGELRD